MRALRLSVRWVAARARRLAALAGLLAALAGPVEADETAAIDIVRNPNAYSNRYLTVRGTMMNLRPDTTVGIAVSPGMIFDLVAGPAFLVVRSVVPPPCQIGSSVMVEGRFVPMATIRQQLYTNLIEATRVTCR
jgi:hypothetical protein